MKIRITKVNMPHRPYRKRTEEMDNAIFAAIAMALHDNDGYNLHDNESGKLTIKSRASEWSSKGAKMTSMP